LHGYCDPAGKGFMGAFRVRNIVSLFKDAFGGFSKHKVSKLGGSLAYFTMFSLGPMLLVVISFLK
jgi:membrane protein